MAAFLGIAATSEILLTSGSAKTLVQIAAPSNHRVKVVRWGVFFDGVSVSAEPASIRLLRQTSSGTMSALTANPLDDSLSETLQTLAQYNATSEPSAGAVVDTLEVHPQTGYEIIYPLGQEVIVGGGDKLGIECTLNSNGVNAKAKLIFEE